MTFEEIKEVCDEEVKKFPHLEKKYRKELSVAQRFYRNGRNLYQELVDKKDKIDTRYVIPYLLKITDTWIDKPPVYIQVKPGASGGIDIDVDVAPAGREKIYNYLKEKYGNERVLHVGTFSTLGPASAAKDVLRANSIDFGKSNKFTKVLEKQETWQENLDRIKANDKINWNFYLDNKDVLDDVPHLIGKIRQSGKHAGGIVVSEKAIYNYPLPSFWMF